MPISLIVMAGSICCSYCEVHSSPHRVSLPLTTYRVCLPLTTYRVCLPLTTYRVSLPLTTYRVSLPLTTYRVSLPLTTYRVCLPLTAWTWLHFIIMTIYRQHTEPQISSFKQPSPLSLHYVSLFSSKFVLWPIEKLWPANKTYYRLALPCLITSQTLCPQGVLHFIRFIQVICGTPIWTAWVLSLVIAYEKAIVCLPWSYVATTVTSQKWRFRR